MMRKEPGRAEGSVEVEIRAVCEQDRPDWHKLFASYGRFYDQQMSEKVFDRVWRWLMDEDHPTSGLVAVKDGQIVGFAHFRHWCDWHQNYGHFIKQLRVFVMAS